jgi:hypothetical protein
MSRRSSTAKSHDEEYELDEEELLIEECQDRTLVLSKQPLPRKVHLMAAGVREVRCICCQRVRPIAEAEDFGEGWMCRGCYLHDD